MYPDLATVTIAKSNDYGDTHETAISGTPLAL